MRIALDATPLLGPVTGVGAFTRGALRALAARDDVDVVTYALSWRGRRRLPDMVPPGVSVTTRPMPAGMLLRAWERAPLPPAEAFVGRVDVVHGTNYVVPPARRAATVVSVYDLTAVRFPELCAPSSLRYPGLVRAAVARGALVHTMSASIAHEVVDLLAVPRERVHVVASGVDVGANGDAAKGRALAGSDRYVLSLGTVEPRKALPDLVSAFDAIATMRPDVDLVIAGPDGWGVDELEAAIRNARHGDRVRRLGWVGDHDRADLLAGAALLAVPSRYEGFGYPPLEAMAAGTPVVSTRAGSLAEVVDGGGLLVDAGDVDGLAQAIEAVLGDPALAASLVERGRAQVARFRWDDGATGLVALYEAAIEGRR
ncbi:MAG TPA: glycosyltransferase family 1 protein [Acidimicrobiales bacterium]|nr:glycosyltransferase family 1 protein [Acidimicrobiales bacterium]